MLDTLGDVKSNTVGDEAQTIGNTLGNVEAEKPLYILVHTTLKPRHS